MAQKSTYHENIDNLLGVYQRRVDDWYNGNAVPKLGEPAEIIARLEKLVVDTKSEEHINYSHIIKQDIVDYLSGEVPDEQRFQNRESQIESIPPSRIGEIVEISNAKEDRRSHPHLFSEVDDIRIIVRVSVFDKDVYSGKVKLVYNAD
jgi:hypothetical protein